MTDNTQLTSASGYDTTRMIFSEPQSGNIPNSVPAINFKRIIISTRNEDGTIGDLIFPTSQLFSFGVSASKNQETGKINGYVMPLCLWNKDGPSKEEKEWTNTFDSVVECCKRHLISNREKIEQYELEMNDLKKFNPLYWKRDKGKIMEGTGPTLYAKLIMSKKHNKIVSMYYDSNGEEIDPLAIAGKFCFANAAIKIESIFIGSKITLQVKLYECEVKLTETGMKRMMKKRPESSSLVTIVNTNSVEDDERPTQEDVEDSDASLNDSDEDEKIITKKQSPVKKKITRRGKTTIRKTTSEV